MPKKPPARPSSASDRDSQQLRVYRAEKMAMHLLIGGYWTQEMTEIQVLDLIEAALNHPSVLARWGDISVKVEFPTKGNMAWATRGERRIFLPPDARNPLIILHEVAHLLLTSKPEPHHGPGFVAIYRYLVRLVLGEDAARTLDACFVGLAVKADDNLIPSAKVPSGATWRRDADIPGVTPLQATEAAQVVHLAATAGLFGAPGDPARANAFTIARRLKALGNTKDGKPKPPARIPETVTVSVAGLLRANTRDDVAEIVLQAVRKDMFPVALKPPAAVKPKSKKRSRAKIAESQGASEGRKKSKKASKRTG